VYVNDDGTGIEQKDVPQEWKERVAAARQKMIENLADGDDEIAEKYLDGKEITVPEIMAAIRRATIAGKFLPVLTGTALRNKGVQLLLNAVTDFLPSPLDIPPVKGIVPGKESEGKVERPCDPNAPLASLVFKVATDPYVGKLFYTRIYSGTINQGDTVYNSSDQKRERVSKIVVMHANKQEIVEKASAGEIVAVVGLKDSKTGQTLCDPENKILLENMRIPEPVVSMSIEPKTKADSDKLGLTLRKFLDEDPSLRVNYNHETGQTIISGMGELHLEIIVDRMRREFNLEANTGRPEVAYKETISVPVMNVEGKHIAQSGGRGQYGHVVINVEPAEKRGMGIEFVNQIKGGTIPREFIKPVEKGIIEAAQNGFLAGFPATDFKVTLFDGSYHDVDSSELSFHLAAKAALREAFSRGKPVLLEPIMDVELVSPEEFMGSVMGDINTRRAKILNLGNQGILKTARCEVPLSEMFNYVNAIRSLSQGRASFTMEPAFYDVVPQYVADKVVGEREQALGRKK